MLLETVLTVYLTGLMTSVGDNAADKERVAIIDDREHVPVIAIVDPAVKHPQILRIQKGDRISFRGVPRGDGRAEPSYDKYVLDLSKVLTGGGLDNEVELGTEHKEVLAYMEFPEGKLRAKALHKKKAVLKNAQGTVVGTPQCVSKVVEFTSAPTNAPIELVVHHQNANASHAHKPVTVSIPAGAQVLVANFGVNHTGTHFPKYKHLSSQATSIVTIDASTDDCTETPAPASASRAAFQIPSALDTLIDDHPECTMTDYP